MNLYLEVSSNGEATRELRCITLHGAQDDDGNPVGVIVEKHFEGDAAPVEKQFSLDDGHGLLAYLADCLGVDSDGTIAANSLGGDDESDDGDGDGESGDEDSREEY